MNNISIEQEDYFQNSVMRDPQGNLLVFYHGTPYGTYNEFYAGTHFTRNKEYADRYQNPSASSNVKSMRNEELTPKTYAVYLNITKPFDTRFTKERDIFYNEYLGKYSASTAGLSKNGFPDWTESENLLEFFEKKEYDYDGLILDEGSDGGYEFDVSNRGFSYVIRYPNEAKDIENLKPTLANEFNEESTHREFENLLNVLSQSEKFNAVYSYENRYENEVSLNPITTYDEVAQKVTFKDEVLRSNNAEKLKTILDTAYQHAMNEWNLQNGTISFNDVNKVDLMLHINRLSEGQLSSLNRTQIETALKRISTPVENRPRDIDINFLRNRLNVALDRLNYLDRDYRLDKLYSQTEKFEAVYEYEKKYGKNYNTITTYDEYLDRISFKKNIEIIHTIEGLQEILDNAYNVAVSDKELLNGTNKFEDASLRDLAFHIMRLSDDELTNLDKEKLHTAYERLNAPIDRRLLLEFDINNVVKRLNSTLGFETIGSGSMGAVIKYGDKVYKNLRENEAEVYTALQNVEGIAKGEVALLNGVLKIKTDYYDKIISTDDIRSNMRQNETIRNIIKENYERIINAVSNLSSQGYSYSDPLQFGYSIKTGKLDLLDFSNAYIPEISFGQSSIDQAFEDNFLYLRNYFSAFGREDLAQISSSATAFERISKLDNHTLQLMDDKLGLEFKRAVGDTKLNNIYFSYSARTVGIKDAYQFYDDEIKKNFVFSERQLSQRDILEWELNPVKITFESENHEKVRKESELRIANAMEVYREMPSNENKIDVAIESTNEYAEDNFHRDLIDIDVQNEDGSYGKVVDLYRVVYVNENLAFTPIFQNVFKSEEEARRSIAQKDNLNLVPYDNLVNETLKKQMELKKVVESTNEANHESVKQVELDDSQKNNEAQDNPNKVRNKKESLQEVQESDSEKSKKDVLLEKIQTGVKSVLESENLKNYLNTSSKLFKNKYSFNNTILVWLQKRDASYVMGYEDWKKFGRNVIQGAQAAQIIVPVMAKEETKGSLYGSIKKNLKEQFSRNPSLELAMYRLGSSKIIFTMNKAGIVGLKDNGQERGLFKSDEELKKYIDRAVLGKVPVFYKVGNVFDVKDVCIPEYLWLKNGFTKDEIALDNNDKPIKNKHGETKIINTPERQARYQEILDNRIVVQDPEKMKILFDACVSVSERNGVKVFLKDKDSDDTLKDGAKGYFHKKNKDIVVDKDLEITEKCAVMFHEMGHSDLHKNLEKLAQQMGIDKITQSMREVQAESVAYCTASNFGIETDTSSFAYLALYSKGFELQDFQKSLEVIHKECTNLTADIKAELDLRGLNLDLTPKVSESLEPDTKKAFIKSYVEFVLEQEAIYDSAMKELPTLLTQSQNNQGLIDVLKEQKNNLDIRKEDLDSIKDSVKELTKAVSRSLQSNIISDINNAMSRINERSDDFEKLTERFISLNQDKDSLREEYTKNPYETLEKLKTVYPRLNDLTEFQMRYISKSIYISYEYGKLLNTKPEEFINKACDRADIIGNYSSKNGTFIEITGCEKWTDKPVFEDGAILHPKVCDTIMKKREIEIREIKAEEEKKGGYHPYTQCSLIVFTPTEVKNGLSALYTHVNIGSGNQEGLKEHLQSCCSRGQEKHEIYAKYEDSLKERASMKKIYLPSANSHGDENEIKKNNNYTNMKDLGKKISNEKNLASQRQESDKNSKSDIHKISRQKNQEIN
ncbi:MAG: ArdC-like ssDNA-binding domain-containing protein [Oscillospiraceae bacterium]|nr:ArdC-like ssDNA-binding domain-containing protein [Oscillospiraceae bacterium]